MGRRVGQGMGWLLGATVLVKAASLANIAILGLLLAKEDFGIFGTAIGVAALVNVLRDGGVRRILIHKGLHRYEGLVGPVYAWTLMLNVLAAAILTALGPALAAYHGDRQYVWVMATLGFAALIYGPSMIYRARLAMGFQYRLVAAMNATSALVRYAAMIALALAGAGPLTFTISLIVMAAYEWLFGLLATKDPLIRFRLRLRLWPAIWARSRWLLASALALALLRQGDYLALGMILDQEVMGVYVFAYMIGDQIMALLASNLQQVLMPTMAAFQHERQRHVRAVLRVAGSIVLAASAVAGGIAVVFDPLQNLVWAGKWTQATPAVQALALCFALRLLVAVQESALTSAGRFRTQFHALLIQGLGMTAVALVGGLLFPTNPGRIAMGVALWFAVGVTAVAAWSLRPLGVRPGAFLATVFRPWATLTALAVLVILANPWLDALAGSIAPRHAAVQHALSIVLAGSAYALLAVLAIRLTLAGTLADMLAVLPTRLADRLGALLRLPRAARLPAG
ncbi:MAG: hypothetical protein KatS3mg103_1020 [Phycisphaerales bacterium]|nr:MAG: hypothetical protein KatS3mg103_1020 [Phycisphaerales bacterium]